MQYVQCECVSKVQIWRVGEGASVYKTIVCALKGVLAVGMSDRSLVEAG